MENIESKNVEKKLKSQQEQEPPSLEFLISKSLEEMEKKPSKIEESGENRIEKVSGSLGVEEREVEEEKQKMAFDKRGNHVLGKMQDLIDKTKEKIVSIFGKKEVAKIEENKIEKKEMIHESIESAKLQANIRKELTENYNVSTKELIEEIEKSNLPVENQEKLVSLVERIKNRQKDIAETRKKYENDIDLFEACFGFEPKGKIEIAQGIASLGFKCSDPEDYIKIRTLNTEARGIKVDDEVMDDFKRGVGTSISFSKIPELKKSLIIENINKSKEEGVFKHEDQHAYYKLFEKKIDKKGNRDGIRKNPDDEKEIVEHLDYRLEMALEYETKDEFLAFYKQGKSLDDIYNSFLFDKGIYNAFRNDEKRATEQLKEEKVSNEIIEKSLERMHDNYEDVVKEAAGVIMVLEIMKLSRDEIVEFLIDKPMIDWPKAIEDIKNQKKA